MHCWLASRILSGTRTVPCSRFGDKAPANPAVTKVWGRCPSITSLCRPCSRLLADSGNCPDDRMIRYTPLENNAFLPLVLLGVANPAFKSVGFNRKCKDDSQRALFWSRFAACHGSHSLSGDDGRTEGTITSVFGSTPTRTIDAIRCRAPVTEESWLLGEA